MLASRVYSLVYIILLPFLGCNVSVNDNITIAAGNVANGSQNTVNGSIFVGAGAQVRGDCRTVNGSVRLEREAACSAVQTVNGEITLAGASSVRGNVASVNGAVRCGEGASIGGEINTVNGAIDLRRTEVGATITTINGDIRLDDASRVLGDIIVKDNKGNNDQSDIQKIEIAGGSVLEGNIMVEDARKKVRVIISSGGQVKGEIENAEVVRQ